MSKTRTGLTVLASAIALLLGLFLAPPTTATGPCPGKAVFAESQAWWSPNPAVPGGDNFGHVHVNACIPERDTISSLTTMPVNVILHHNPGTLRDISVVYKTTASETTVAKLVPPGRSCPVTDTCTFTTKATIDPAKFDRSGLQEIRLRVFVDQPDGKSMHTSINFQTYIGNGESLSNVTRKPFLRSKGWYTNYGYCEARILSVPLSDGPVSGTLVLRVEQVDHGSDDVNPSHHSVRLDSNAHHGIPGTVLREGPGPLPATALAIDTTTLSNGTHRLVQRVDCAQGDQINSGVNVIAFDVQNGT